MLLLLAVPRGSQRVGWLTKKFTVAASVTGLCWHQQCRPPTRRIPVCTVLSAPGAPSSCALTRAAHSDTSSPVPRGPLTSAAQRPSAMSDSDAPAERMSLLVTPPANEETNMAARTDSSAAAATAADGGSAAASAARSPVVTAAPPLPPHPTLHVHTDSSSLLPIVSPVPVTPDAVPSPSSTPRNAAGGGSGLAAPSSGASGAPQSHSPSLSPSPPPLFLDAFRGCPRIAGTEWRATALCLSSARGPIYLGLL